MKSHDEGERERQISYEWETTTDSDRHGDTLMLLPLCWSAHHNRCSHNDARGDGGRRREDGGGGRQAGRGCWVTEREAGEWGSCSTDDRETEGGGGRERGRVYPQDVRAGSRGGGGLPDWMGPAMPWWSMGQVLGFSHCRESAFVLLLPSVFPCRRPAFVYLTVPSSYVYIPAQHLLLLTAVSIVCVSSASPPSPSCLLSIPLSCSLPSINTWLNGWMQCRGRPILLLLHPIHLQIRMWLWTRRLCRQACQEWRRSYFSPKASVVLSCLCFILAFCHNIHRMSSTVKLKWLMMRREHAAFFAPPGLIY